MLLILAALFGLLTLVLVIAISFPLEWQVARLAKATKKALDALDEAKGALYRARKAKKDVAAEIQAVRDAVEVADKALAQERKSGTMRQTWAIIAAFWCGGLFAFFLVLGLLAMLHPVAGWTGFWLVLLGGLYYFGKLIFDLNYGKIETRQDIDFVKEDEIGVKVILGRPYRIVSSGPRFAPTRFVRIVHVPTRLFLYKIREDNVLTSGKEAAKWILDMTIRYRIDRDAWSLVRFFGTKIDEIHKLLTGHFDTDGLRQSRGIIGDEITSIARAWIGNAENIPDVDTGLSAQEQIATVIDHDLELALGLYGLGFDTANITDFDVQDEISKARTDRTAALVAADTAKHQADARRAVGVGERDYQKAIVEADAFRAEQIIKAKIGALQTMNKGGQEWALNLLTLLVIGEEGLEKLKSIGTINLFALEGIGGIVNQITSALGGRGGEEEVVERLKRLPPGELNKIRSELNNLLKGGTS